MRHTLNMLIKIRESVITKPTLHQKNVIRIDLLILSSPGMLLCATKLFVEVCDNLPAHTHTPSHRFICLTSAQGCNQWHQLHKSKPWWGELQGKLKNLNMAKKIGRTTKKSRKKHSWWKELKVWATVTMKEIPLATKDRALNDDMVFQWCAKQIV